MLIPRFHIVSVKVADDLQAKQMEQMINNQGTLKKRKS